MAKDFKKWIDEFVENGADPANVTKWPSEAGGGGTKVVTELPEVGEEHTIYELHPTTPSKFNYVPCMNEIEFRYVFENEEAFRDFVRNFATHYNNHNEFYCYCLAEDELIRVYYNSGSANWTLLDNEEENVFIYNNERYCICKAIIDEHTALLLNGKQVHLGDSNGILYGPVLIHQVKSKVLCAKDKFGMVFPIMNRTLPSCVDGVPSVLLMSNNFYGFCTDINSGIVQWVTNDGSIKVALPYVDGKYRYDKSEKHYYDTNTSNLYNGEFDWVNIEDFNFKEYVDYETYDTIPLSEGGMGKPFIFDPSGKSTTSYWIYKNGEWVNVDDMSTEPPLHRTVYGTLTDVEGSRTLACSLTIDEIVNNLNNGYITILEYKPTIDGSDYYYCAITGAFANNGTNLTLQTWSLGSGSIYYNPNSGFYFDSGVA